LAKIEEFDLHLKKRSKYCVCF